MPELTRRRNLDAPQTTWLIHYGDVRVGVIAERIGNPDHTPPWEWACGFYPGSHPRECTHGTAATFDDARAAFEAAWRIFLASRTEADFQQWRDDRAFDAWKRGLQIADAGWGRTLAMLLWRGDQHCRHRAARLGRACGGAP